MKKLLAVLSLLPGLAMAQSANISQTTVGLDGFNLATSAQDAVSPTYFSNDGQTLLYLDNESGGSLSAEVITQKTSVQKNGYGTITLSNQTVTVPNGNQMLVGPFPTSRWNTTNGTVRVSLSTVSGVSATAVKMP